MRYSRVEDMRYLTAIEAEYGYMFIYFMIYTPNQLTGHDFPVFLVGYFATFVYISCVSIVIRQCFLVFKEEYKTQERIHSQKLS